MGEVVAVALHHKRYLVVARRPPQPGHRIGVDIAKHLPRNNRRRQTHVVGGACNQHLLGGMSGHLDGHRIADMRLCFSQRRPFDQHPMARRWPGTLLGAHDIDRRLAVIGQQIKHRVLPQRRPQLDARRHRSPPLGLGHVVRLGNGIHQYIIESRCRDCGTGGICTEIGTIKLLLCHNQPSNNRAKGKYPNRNRCHHQHRAHAVVCQIAQDFLPSRS